jgi:uroporphyrinogen III methyltransferase / synthase
MGGQHLLEIVEQLQQQGRSPHTPIAVIRWAGHPQQQIWAGTLATIVNRTRDQKLSPTVIVIGEVVALRHYLQPSQPPPVDIKAFSPLPLAGKTILVTRSLGQSSQFSAQLRSAGAQVIEMPALEIQPPSSWEALDGAIAQLQNFDWLILTSTNGVNYFFERLASQGKDARALAGVKIAVVGEKTALSLQQHGLKPDFIPPAFVADSLVTHFPADTPLEGCRILFPRVESGGREVLVAEFRAKGAEVTEVAAYQSACPAQISPAALAAIQQQAMDVITFASSKTVQHFHQLVAAESIALPPRWLDRVCIASIGPQTSQACQSLLGRVDVEAQEYTLDGLTQALIEWAERG